MYSSHTDIKLCTYCLYRHTTVLIHEILYLATNSSHTSHHPSQTLCLPWIFYSTQKPMLDSCKMVEKLSKAFHTFLWHFLPSLKQNFIAFRSSKVWSCPDCIFKIHQLWQSDFSRVYFNCCCSCSFEAEIIKNGQSTHKTYGNNILNFKCLYKKGLETYKAPGMWTWSLILENHHLMWKCLFLIKRNVLCFVCIHMEVITICCLHQNMQQGFYLGSCICKKRYVICVVCARNSLCRISSASCLF